jgi:hypothetical protein
LSRKRSAATTKALLISPLVVVAFVVGGAELGLYLAAMIEFSPLAASVIFGTTGLFLSFPVLVKIVDIFASREAKDLGRETSAKTSAS